MKRSISLYIIFHLLSFVHAQTSPDSLAKNSNADDPSSFITRLEVFNELQYHDEDFYLNQTVIRTIVKIGNKFTTRLDVPLVHNSISTPAGYQQFGLGDISFRLLGYQLAKAKKSVITASIEVSLNTAESPLLGLGKNVIIPVITYSKLIPKEKMLFALFLQQANSFSGDEARRKVSFTKVQPILLKFWSQKVWSIVAPSIYIDYVKGGTSMNLETRTVFSPVPRMNIWGQAGVGVFGKFGARYEWSIQVGVRYFLLRAMNWKK
jgi:hypothetical protein